MVSFVRMMTPTFLLGARPTNEPKLKRVAVVPDDGAVRGLEIVPTHGVGQSVAERDPRHAGDGEILRRDDLVSFERAVGELQADPPRHVLDVGVDVAGPGEMIGEDRRERHLDRAFQRPAVAVRMVGRAFDGFDRPCRVLHAERIEQVALKDVSPAGCTCGIRNDAACEQVRDVRVSERRPET